MRLLGPQEIEQIAAEHAKSFTGNTATKDNVALFEAFTTDAEREQLQQALLAKGASPAAVQNARELAQFSKPTVTSAITQRFQDPKLRRAYGLLSTVSMAASAYHGYKRNNSIGWALIWGLLGAAFPVIVPVIAVAQGFGKRK